MRFKKLKAGNLSGSAAHVHRTIHSPTADPSREQLNKTIGSTNPAEAIRTRVNEITGGKQRKDAVLAYEFIMTAKADWFKDKSQKEISQWAATSIRWLWQTFGKENVVSSTLHLDEAAPHIHAYVVPEVDGRLCAKALTGTKKLCSDMQTSYANAVEQHGLSRGLKGSKATHITPSEFHSLIQNPGIPELPGRLASNKTREQYQNAVKTRLATANAEIMGLSKAKAILSKLLETIGKRSFKDVKDALNHMDDHLQKTRAMQLEIEKLRSEKDQVEQELSIFRSAAEKAGVSTPQQMSRKIEAAEKIIKRDRTRREKELSTGNTPSR